MSASLILFGTICFLIGENLKGITLSNMNLSQQLLISLFQSITLRTAGFATVSIGNCSKIVKFVMLILMLIGGSPGGTAGGLKTTTFAVLIQTVYYAFRGMGDSIHMFGRRITLQHVTRALLMMGIYIGYLMIAISLLYFYSDEGISFFALIFEAFSAIATVGLSFGITEQLSFFAKLIIIALMFIGRVGPLAMLELIQKRKERIYGKHVQYPDADILIG